MPVRAGPPTSVVVEMAVEAKPRKASPRTVTSDDRIVILALLPMSVTDGWKRPEASGACAPEAVKPSMVRGAVIGGSVPPRMRCGGPARSNTMRSASGVALAAVMAAVSVPGPLFVVVVTVNVAAKRPAGTPAGPAGPAAAWPGPEATITSEATSAQRTAAERWSMDSGAGGRLLPYGLTLLARTWPEEGGAGPNSFVHISRNLSSRL